MISPEKLKANRDRSRDGTPAMISPEKLKANRANALRSTGPRTPGGKARSRLNAVTHGLTAQTLILPGEDEPEYQRRLAAWRTDLAPCNAYEEDLVRQAVSLSWRLDRADRVQAALLAQRLAAVPADEEARRRDEVEDLGRRLWPDAQVPRSNDHPGTRPAMPIGPDDPDDPARLVHRLEATAEGCRWLLDRWAALRRVVDAGTAWLADAMVGAIRLLGKRPLDAADDRQVLAIVLACHVLGPDQPDPFAALWETLTPSQVEYYRNRLAGRGLAEARPRTKEEARRLLLEIVDEAVESLEVLEARWRERAAARRAARADWLRHDDSPEGEWLRRQQGRSTRAILRIVERFRAARRRGVPLSAEPPARHARGGGSRPAGSIDTPTASEHGHEHEGLDRRGPEVPEAGPLDLSRRPDPVTTVDVKSEASRPTATPPGPRPRPAGARAASAGRWARLLGALLILLPFLTAAQTTDGPPPTDRPEVAARPSPPGDREGSWDHRPAGFRAHDPLATPLKPGLATRNRQNEPNFAGISPVFGARPARVVRSADRSRSPP
jgi:hypothetical protein